MGEDSIMDYMKIGLEYMFIAMFLLLFVQVVEIRNKYAETAVEQQVALQETKEQMEFAAYNTGTNLNSTEECILGDAVLSCMRDYASRSDSSVSIYVYDGSSVLSLTDANRKQKDLFTVQKLMKQISVTSYYHPYLLYDRETFQTDPSKYKHSGANVTGIAFYKK